MSVLLHLVTFVNVMKTTEYWVWQEVALNYGLKLIYIEKLNVRGCKEGGSFGKTLLQVEEVETLTG